MNDEIAIPSHHGAHVARAFPMEQRDRRLAVGPSNSRGQKMSELGFLLDGMSELGYVEWQRIRLVAAHQFNGGDHEQLERYHRGNRVARQAECGLLVAPAEDGGLARANCDRIEEKFGSEFAKNLFDEVVLAD